MAVFLRVLLRSLAFALAIAATAHWLHAQDSEAPKKESSPAASSPAGPGATPGGDAAARPVMPGGPGGPSGEPGKPGDPTGKPPEQGKPSETSKNVQRPPKPETPANPDELKVRPDDAGEVRLNFNGQPWPDVLKWFAEISGMSLDWQELPGDNLNLKTQRKYTVREVRDLINRHLLARGFTLLRQGEMLTVVEIKKLDPALVPRLNPEDLAKPDLHDQYDYAKVSFSLDWLLAEKAVNDLKPFLSRNGKLTAMAETNRLEAMDSVANLREIYTLLRQEQSVDSQHRLVKKFKLEYARAAEVRDELQTLLGLESKSGLGSMMPQNPEQAQQQAMMMARMQQGGGPGQPGGQPGAQPDAAKAKGAVTLVANERENSILAHAPPDKMVIIAQAIEAIDVPTDSSRSLLSNMSQMKVYRLPGVDPELVVKTLTQLGNLSPNTRLEVDKKNKSIIAYASLVDHVLIGAVTDKLSGSERKFEVLRLHRLPADFVAGSIMFMMGIDPKKKKEKANPWSWGPSAPAANEVVNEFRVDADVEHNRLMLYANDVELSEVNNLLVKLGELPPKGGNTETTRVIDSGSPQETQELLDQIRRHWPGIAPNPLTLPPVSPATEPLDSAPRQPVPQQAVPPAPARTAADQPLDAILSLAELRRDVIADEALSLPKEEAGSSAQPAPSFQPAQPAGKGGSEESEPAAAAAVKAAPPVNVQVGPDGKIIVSSQDTQALDAFEDLAIKMAPPRKEYKVFHLKRAGVYGVAQNLEDFFKSDKKEQPLSFWDRIYGTGNQDDSENDVRLSKRRKLKFIPDPDTNTILVDGGDQSQLRTIEELITLYDRPPPTDSESVRKTETIALKYSKANVVANTVKDVYRDLLSDNDKALGNQTNQGGGRPRVTVFTDSYSDPDKPDRKVPKFKGMLSIGVDETSNSLLVSAPTFLFDHVSRMITELDEAAAANNSIRVVKIGSGVSAERMQELLEDILHPGNSANRSKTPKTPPTQAAAKPAGKSAPKSTTTGAQSTSK
jgi:type II secretory pathway component GspD/PulD (secretin)